MKCPVHRAFILCPLASIGHADIHPNVEPGTTTVPLPDRILQKTVILPVKS